MRYPPHWNTITIGESLGLINGRAFKPNEWTKAGMPIIRIQNLNNPEAHFNHYEGDLPEKFLVQNGDLLFAWSGTPGTSFGAHLWRGGNAWLNQHIFRITFSSDQFDKKFLQLAINQNLQEYVRIAHGGAGLAHITKKMFEASVLPSPSLAEQKRIVAKIEELFSELDEGVANLKKARAQLAVYRQALLKHAFEGRLTAEWRAQHADELESAEELLERIRAEREERYQQQLKTWEKALKIWEADSKKADKPSKPRVPLVAQLPTQQELDKLPGLPAGWHWMRLGSCNTDVFDGPFGSHLKTSDYVGSGIRVVRLENIGVMKFIEEKESFITEAKYRTLVEHTVVPGDIVFSSFITERTRVAMVPPTIDKAVNKADCFCVRCQGTVLMNRYATIVLSTRSTFKQLEDAVHGVGRPRINTTQLKELLIPVCSPAEQQELMNQVDAQFSEIDALEADIDQNLQRAEALRQSILNKAFAGELVPQDGADEPAAALLARIHAEREAQAGKSKTPKTRSKKA
ncbi:restriction endonuclease subunit S [Prosthecobacter sp.]|uniref:restriction endonuclease subunit S n=1 Tax=Prosthecobacter sp. TaxID=1965333 RepID=UPI00378317F0